MTKHHHSGWRCALAIALVAGSAARAEIDLTPVPTTKTVDGVKETYVVFHDGRQEIAYYPPQDWRLNGSGPKLALEPNSVSNADALIEVKPVVSAIPIDQANISKYVAIAQQSVPRGARNLEVLGSTLNPLRICGYDTLAIDFKYEAFGTTYRSQMLYLNRDRDQWTFRFTAQENDFRRAFEPFRSSLYSLTGLER
jgi:hypothetical protein